MRSSFKLFASAAVLAMLTACAATTPGSPVPATQQACVQIAPITQAASLIRDPKVQSIVGSANAVCGPIFAGVTPATVDSNTPHWLGTLAGMLKVLAPVALSLL